MMPRLMWCPFLMKIKWHSSLKCEKRKKLKRERQKVKTGKKQFRSLRHTLLTITSTNFERTKYIHTLTLSLSLLISQSNSLLSLPLSLSLWKSCVVNWIRLLTVDVLFDVDDIRWNGSLACHTQRLYNFLVESILWTRRTCIALTNVNRLRKKIPID